MHAACCHACMSRVVAETEIGYVYSSATRVHASASVCANVHMNMHACLGWQASAHRSNRFQSNNLTRQPVAHLGFGIELVACQNLFRCESSCHSNLVVRRDGSVVIFRFNLTIFAPTAFETRLLQNNATISILSSTLRANLIKRSIFGILNFATADPICVGSVQENSEQAQIFQRRCFQASPTFGTCRSDSGRKPERPRQSQPQTQASHGRKF